MSRRRVGIFRLTFPEPSETFIRAQLASYQRYQPQVLAKRVLGPTDWPVNAVSTVAGKWGERYFLATRSPRFHLRAMTEPPHLLHAHFGVDGVYAVPLARRLGVPLITTFHGFDVLTRPSWWIRHPTIPSAVYRGFLYQLKNEGARFLAVSRFVAAALVRHGFAPERIVQHYIGVDTARFQPHIGNGEQGRYVLSVGRHVQCKGIDVLLRAFARIARRHPDVRLLQAGSGPLAAELKQLASDLGLQDRVAFLGSRPHDHIVELMKGAEIFALAGVTQENGHAEALGLVFNEASACGVPVASTFSGGIPEAVIDGETGLLCAEHDHKGLADNLDALLSDGSLRHRLGARGRELVCECFDLRRQTAKLEEIYDEVLG